MRSPRGAYVALAALTAIWGTNWIAMKLALASAHPIVFNIDRTLVAIAVLFAVLVVRRRRLLPESWAAVAVTGLFQTTINMGATTMALEGAPFNIRVNTVNPSPVETRMMRSLEEGMAPGNGEVVHESLKQLVAQVERSGASALQPPKPQAPFAERIRAQASDEIGFGNVYHCLSADQGDIRHRKTQNRRQ